MQQSTRHVTLSAAAFVLICFFLPWVQVSCLGAKDSVSGFNLARDDDRVLWLVPFLMLAVLLLGSARFIWERWPMLFALSGTVGGSLSAWLIYREHLHLDHPTNLIATFWTIWFWLSLISSLITATAALWFYVQRARSP